MGIIRETITDVQFVYKSSVAFGGGALAYLIKGNPKTMVFYSLVAGTFAHITGPKAQWHYERYPRWLKLQAQINNPVSTELTDEQKLESLKTEERRQNENNSKN